VLYRATAGFLLGTRITWDGQPEDLHRHVDDVVDALQGAPVIGEIVADGDIGRGSVSLAVVFHAPKAEKDPERVARSLLGEAISASGGMHENLVTLGEGVKMPPRTNAWAGLRTPKWSVRSFALEEVADS
jgi:hypothetical protein